MCQDHNSICTFSNYTLVLEPPALVFLCVCDGLYGSRLGNGEVFLVTIKFVRLPTLTSTTLPGRDDWLWLLRESLVLILYQFSVADSIHRRIHLLAAFRMINFECWRPIFFLLHISHLNSPPRQVGYLVRSRIVLHLDLFWIIEQ